jgi:hypothetical protein
MTTSKRRVRGGFLIAAVACSQAPLPLPPAEFHGHEVVAATAMSSARAAHSATSIGTGRVLIAGGFGGAGSRSTELYSAASDRFTSGPWMGTARHSHTGTVLRDGRVLIAGGMDGSAYLTSAEIYDPVRNSFSPTAGAMTTARSGHQAVLLNDGRVLVVGGVGTGWTFLASAELYDPATDRFVATNAMSVPRESHTLTILDDGTVLVTGGHRGRRSDIVLYASAERFTPATGQWTPAASMTLRRHKHDAVRLGNGNVLITGGSDERDDRGAYRSSEIYDPVTNRFIAAAPMVHARYKHQGTSLRLDNGMVLIVGGAQEPEAFDPATNSFAVMRSSVPMPGSFSAAAPIGASEVLVTGGYGQGSEPTNRAWRVRVP